MKIAIIAPERLTAVTPRSRTIRSGRTKVIREARYPAPSSRTAKRTMLYRILSRTISRKVTLPIAHATRAKFGRSVRALILRLADSVRGPARDFAQDFARLARALERRIPTKF